MYTFAKLTFGFIMVFEGLLSDRAYAASHI